MTNAVFFSGGYFSVWPDGWRSGDSVLEIKWLKDYVALVEQGSFSRAADARFVTQPAFSRRIRSLEAWLGTSLVDRDQHPLQLTSAGEAFAEEAGRLISQLYAMRGQLKDLELGRAQLKIMAQHALAVAFFPSWLNTLEALTDGALISVEAGNLHDSVETFLAGNSDFLLAYGRQDMYAQLKRTDIEMLQVGLDQLIPVSLADESGEAIHRPDPEVPMRLLNHPAESFFGRLIQQHCLPELAADYPLHIACENGLSEALKALVLQGYGVAWLPGSLIRAELESGRLVSLEAPMRTVDLTICLYRHRQSGCDSAVRFWNYLQELYHQTAVNAN